MTSSSEPGRRQALAALWLATAALAAAGCSRDLLPSGTSPVTEPLAVGLAVSRPVAVPGDTVALLPLVRRNDGGPLAGVQGTLRFDATALRYVGQPLEGEAFILVNNERAGAGELRVASLRLGGLPEATADLRFEVLRPGWADLISYDLEEAATPAGQALYRAERLPLEVRAVAPAAVAPAAVAPRTLEDWWAYFRLTERVLPRIAGQGFRFGDVTLNSTVDVLDASAVANLAVGNRALLTEVNRDYVIAGDVAPANSPGLGEAGDPIPPGRNPDGSYGITVLDAVEINNEAVGNDRLIPGELVPGRTPRRAPPPGPRAAVVQRGTAPDPPAWPPPRGCS